MLMLLITTTSTKAQTWNEWFNQKKTQIKYLTKQIAELQIYGGYLKQGYHISQNGLGTISGWTKGEFNLHQGYYQSLKTVNPQIKDDPKATAIIEYQDAIIGDFDLLDGITSLTNENRQYIVQVKKKVLEECDTDLSELRLVMISGKAEMTDDERIKRLDKVFMATKEKYQFTQSFTSHVRSLVLQKSEEEQNIKTLKKYYGIIE